MPLPYKPADIHTLLIAAKRQFTAQHERFFLWSPLPLMLGIALFFCLPADPAPMAAATAFPASLCLAMLCRRSKARLPAIALCLFALGFAASQLRVSTMTMPLITQEWHYRDVQGRVELVEPYDKKLKVTLNHLTIEGLAPQASPPRVRLTLRGEQPAFEAGDTVHLKANLFPLPAPTMPGGFDFALYYYFNGIGGTGYSLSPVTILQPAQDNGWTLKLNNLRHAIGENMRSHMPGQAGAVAAAMTIGETGPIAQTTNDDLRDSGLYHILSISGFHLAVVTGVVFAAIRLLLSLTPAVALRINTKKIAALLALLAAFAYLALAAYPLPAQRSFIMVAFVFIAILCDRKGISLRSLCFAALFLLLCFPESLFSASFQLSFASTLAIVSLYENWPLPTPRTKRGRAAAYMLGIFATSLAASLATAPFIIYDFNRLSLLGILSNMLVLPLASILIMPAIIIAVLLMPLGLAWLAYPVVDWSTNLMLIIAHATSGWQLSAIRMPSLSLAGVMLAGLGLLWLCLWQGRLRLWGIPMLIIALLTIHQHQPIDMFISAGAKQVIVRLPGGGYTALKGTSRAYAVQSWLQSEGQGELVPLKESGIACDTYSCTYAKNGTQTLMVTQAQADSNLDKACKRAPDILIAPRYLHKTRCPGPRMLIGKSELEAYGPHAFRFKEGGIIETLRTHEPGTPRRQWQPTDENEDED